MSFERFSSSDVYMYEHVGGFIECCGCWLEGGLGISIEESDESSWFVKLKTAREALEHLDKHEKAGHDIGGARRRIEKAFEDLDAPIEPYVRSEEDEARIREKMKEAYGKEEE